jgi:RNA polymerase sigma-70 factor (ECF subfamily)
LQDSSAEERIRGGLRRDEPEAVEWMWDRYAANLFAVLQALLGSRHDAEDVLQRVFVSIIKNRRRVAGAQSLDAYVYRMARNEAVSFLRQRRSKTGPGADRWLTPTRTDERSEGLVRDVQTALARLPRDQREVIVLKLYQEKIFREVAQVIGISPNTAASRYRYGLEKLRGLLKDHTP